MKTVRSLSLGVLLGVACAPRSPSTGDTAHASGRTQTDRSPLAAKAPSTEDAAHAPGDTGATTLLVANGQGVHEYDVTGKLVRTRTPIPAQTPRRLAGGDVLFLSKSATTRTLYRIDSTDKLTTVAKLPVGYATGACKFVDDAPEGSHEWLHMESADDFVVAADGATACFTFRDRNANMADVEVVVTAALASGAVEGWVNMNKRGGCKAEKPAAGAAGLRVEGKSVFCAAGRPWSTSGAEADFQSKFGFDKKKQTITSNAHGEVSLGTTKARTFTVEGYSPSGQWVVISGCRDDSGDYVYRSLYLVDRATGDTHTLQAGKGTSAISKRNVSALGGCSIETLTVTGEATVAWLSDELLIVDKIAIRPGIGTWTIDGDVAW